LFAPAVLALLLCWLVIMNLRRKDRSRVRRIIGWLVLEPVQIFT